MLIQRQLSFFNTCYWFVLAFFKFILEPTLFCEDQNLHLLQLVRPFCCFPSHVKRAFQSETNHAFVPVTISDLLPNPSSRFNRPPPPSSPLPFLNSVQFNSSPLPLPHLSTPNASSLSKAHWRVGASAIHPSYTSVVSPLHRKFLFCNKACDLPEYHLFLLNVIYPFSHPCRLQLFI